MCCILSELSCIYAACEYYLAAKIDFHAFQE